MSDELLKTSFGKSFPLNFRRRHRRQFTTFPCTLTSFIGKFSMVVRVVVELRKQLF